MNTSGLLRHQLRQSQSLVADLRFHPLLIDVHRDDDVRRSIIQNEVRISLDRRGAESNSLAVSFITDSNRPLPVNPLQRLLSQDDDRTLFLIGPDHGGEHPLPCGGPLTRLDVHPLGDRWAPLLQSCTSTTRLSGRIEPYFAARAAAISRNTAKTIENVVKGSRSSSRMAGSSGR